MASFNVTVIENFSYGVWRAYWPDAAEYEKTDRKFPVVVITAR